ncbi:MAG TPA: hypothetical protein VFZ78_01800, partial [Flavisolibacter sp.]
MRILVVILFLLSLHCFSQPAPSKIDSVRAVIAERSTRLRVSQDSFLRVQESLQRARVAVPAKKHDTTARTENISKKIS